MDKLKLILLKILLLTTIVAILFANTADAKKTKSYTKKKSIEHLGTNPTENHHKKIKRSTYSRNWGTKPGYGSYDLPPYLVYNKKSGAYHPYFKYPENNLRRYLRKMSKQYTAGNRYSTLPQQLDKRYVK